MSKSQKPVINLQEIMYKQSVLNVGTIGHVANGKSTLVKYLTSKETQQFTKEKERNITIRLGYANAKIWKCASCSEPECFSSSDSSLMSKRCQFCKELLELVNHISIVDCPGHNELTSTMLNGSSVMDYTILVEACNNINIPAPQTAEHLVATTAANIPTCMIVMNKIDLIKKDKARDQIEIINKYISDITKCDKNPPVIPVSATIGDNIDVVCQQLSMLKVPPIRDPSAQFKMIIIRSFDINKPGVDVTKLHGGVIGGTIMRGTLRVGDKINIYPGMVKSIPDDKKEKEGADFMYDPIMGEVLSIKTDMNELEFAIPGGLLGIQLTIDPAFSRGDNLAGSLVLKKTDMEQTSESKKSLVYVYDKIIVKINKFLISEDTAKKMLKDIPNLIINVNSNNIDCRIKTYKSSTRKLFLFLNRPIAIDSQDNLVTIMRGGDGGGSKEIIGRGVILDGISCEALV
jgi:translation initiation factor 2 subunit 3